MTNFLVKYKSRVINVDFIDVAGNVYWGREIYPEASSQRGWFRLDMCEKICNDADEGNREPKTQEK